MLFVSAFANAHCRMHCLVGASQEACVGQDNCARGCSCRESAQKASSVPRLGGQRAATGAHGGACGHQSSNGRQRRSSGVRSRDPRCLTGKLEWYGATCHGCAGGAGNRSTAHQACCGIWCKPTAQLQRHPARSRCRIIARRINAREHSGHATRTVAHAVFDEPTDARQVIILYCIIDSSDVTPGPAHNDHACRARGVSASDPQGLSALWFTR